MCEIKVLKFSSSEVLQYAWEVSSLVAFTITEDIVMCVGCSNNLKYQLKIGKRVFVRKKVTLQTNINLK